MSAVQAAPFVYLKRLYTKKETAELLSCSERQIDYYVKRGLIAPNRAQHRVMFTPESIEAFVQRYQSPIHA